MSKDRHILKSLRANVLKLNEPTKTGRIYTTDCIKETLEDPILKERLEHRALFGVIESDDIYNLFNCSHIVTGLEIEDDKLIAAIDILNNQKGRCLAEALDAGAIRFSVAGKGKVEDNIVTNYELESVVATVRGDTNE